MSEAISITSAHTEALTADTRAAIIQVCRSAHQEDDFLHLFSYIPSGGLHVLASRAHVVVSHAVATTRWLQPKATWMVWCKSTMELSLRTKKRRQIWGLVSRSTARN